MSKNEQIFNLAEGEQLRRSPNKPILQIVGEGEEAYLWIGNNNDVDKACFATLDEKATLRKLARGILAAIGESA